MRFLFISLFLFLTFVAKPHFAQQVAENMVIIDPSDTPAQIIEKAAHVRPSARQYLWQRLELTGFIHFGINTFAEAEWGHKGIDISKFNPTAIDVKQWVRVFKEVGFKLIILTAKHHDGFCLWPSQYTEFDIAKTPFQNGKGDIVHDLSNACREAGIKFGVYLSPWDMNEQSYGTEAYNQYFRNQLTELLTNYGEIEEVWFDGANGEGPNGQRQVYDWHSYYALIRRLQPNAVIAVSGPDVRWVGTESGYGRHTEWSVLPGANMDQNAIAANSQQQALDGAFTPHNLMDEDLGSREKLLKARSLVWYPAEIDVSTRPGWFYHASEDNLVKSPEKLVDIYYNSVGLNGVLLLNIPPDKRGLISDYDIKNLQGMRWILDQTFNENLATQAHTIASNARKSHAADLMLDDDLSTFWTTTKGVNTAAIAIKLPHRTLFNCAMLQENILQGQRIEKFHIDWWNGDDWQLLTEATTIGYKRLLRFPSIITDHIRISIDACRAEPTLAAFGLFEAPPEVEFVAPSSTFGENMTLNLKSDSQNTRIFYTLDDSTPDNDDQIYTKPIMVNATTTITAHAISTSGKKGRPVSQTFHKARYHITLKSQYSEKYAANGKLSLVDGSLGSVNFNDGKWLGYEGNDVKAIIDLGRKKQVNKLAAHCLSATRSFIFLPQSAIFSFSDDGKVFSNSIEIVNSEQEKDRNTFVHTLETEVQNLSTRFVKVTLRNIGTCPQWHPGAGAEAWIFVSEIVVE